MLLDCFHGVKKRDTYDKAGRRRANGKEINRRISGWHQARQKGHRRGFESFFKKDKDDFQN